jgi:hypothetical protein
MHPQVQPHDLQKRRAVHIGHHQVQQYNVGRVVKHVGQGLSPVGYARDLMPSRPKYLGQPLARIAVIIDDENSRHGAILAGPEGTRHVPLYGPRRVVADGVAAVAFALIAVGQSGRRAACAARGGLAVQERRPALGPAGRLVGLFRARVKFGHVASMN